MPRYKFSDLVCYITDKRMPLPGDERTYIGLEHLDSGRLSVTRWGGEIELKGEKLIMKQGDILFGRRNTYLRRAAIAPHDGLFSAHGMIFRPKTKHIDAGYFPFFISSDYFMDAAIRISVGSLSPTVNWKTLKELEFDLPDMADQKKIAGILMAANSTKEAYQCLLEQTDELVKSQFIEMFGGEQNGGELIRLEDCCISISGGGTPSMQHPEYYGGEIPFIKSGDVKGSTVSSGVLSLTTAAIENTNAKLLPAGCVLLVIRSAILRNELPLAISLNPVVINQDLKAFQPKPEFDEYYLYWAIKSKETDLLMKVQTMLTSHIEFTDILNLPVRIAPKSQQKQFREFVEQSEKSKLELKQAIESINVLIKSLMQQDFIN